MEVQESKPQFAGTLGNFTRIPCGPPGDEGRFYTLMIELGVVGTAAELDALIAATAKQQDETKAKCNEIVKVAVDGVDSSRCDRLRDALKKAQSDARELEVEGVKHARAMTQAIASGGDPDPHAAAEQLTKTKLKAVKRLQQRLAKEVEQAEHHLRAARSDAANGARAMLKEALKADVQKRLAEVANVFAAAIPEIYGARKVLDELSR